MSIGPGEKLVAPGDVRHMGTRMPANERHMVETSGSIGRQMGRRAAQTDDGLSRYGLEHLRRQYTDYLGSKSAEIEEAQESRRYRHGLQWGEREIRRLRQRGQPVVTFNRVSRKINAVVGLLERLRQDPKGFARTPKHEDGAELATAVLNYALDANDWKSISPDCAEDGATSAIGGLEIVVEAGDQGDPDISISRIDPREFFYDPRSCRPDFSDATYMGVHKWMDYALVAEMWPESAQAVKDGVATNGGLDDGPTQADRQMRWVNVRERTVRVVEHWYRERGGWSYCFFTGDIELERGPSPFKDERGRTACRLIMYSNMIDHDDDRYGFVRDLKSPQDEINRRRSKALHSLNSRKIRASRGAVDDVEVARREEARPDGFIEINDASAKYEVEQGTADFQGNMAFLTDAKQEIDNFGPNPSLVGEGGKNQSGRAIQLLQQAGIAELGPFLLRYRGWKIRVYRAIWNAIQQFWTSERWIRVTDSDGLAQFVQVNGVQQGEFGQQVLVNALGSLDVDILIDEGPDNVNAMADAFDTLLALAQNGQQIPPGLILKLSALPASVKKEAMAEIEKAQQQNPLVQQAAQIELAQATAEVSKTQAETTLKQAQAAQAGATVGKVQAETGKIGVQAGKEQAQTVKTMVDAHVAAVPDIAPVGPSEQAMQGPVPSDPEGIDGGIWAQPSEVEITASGQWTASLEPAEMGPYSGDSRRDGT
jgi:hypothetical protein